MVHFNSQSQYVPLPQLCIRERRRNGVEGFHRLALCHTEHDRPMCRMNLQWLHQVRMSLFGLLGNGAARERHILEQRKSRGRMPSSRMVLHVERRTQLVSVKFKFNEVERMQMTHDMT